MPQRSARIALPVNLLQRSKLLLRTQGLASASFNIKQSMSNTFCPASSEGYLDSFDFGSVLFIPLPSHLDAMFSGVQQLHPKHHSFLLVQYLIRAYIEDCISCNLRIICRTM